MWSHRVPPPPPALRMTRRGTPELLLHYVDNLAGRRLSEYEAKLLLTIVDSVIAEEGGNVPG